MDAKKRNGVHANFPPSKRMQANGQGMPPSIAPPDSLEEEDEDVFLEETLLRDGEVEESRATVAALFTKWRRPAVANFDTQKSSLGEHFLLCQLAQFVCLSCMRKWHLRI